MRNAVLQLIISAIMGFLLMTGCASAPVEERPEIDRVRVFSAGYDAVWAQLLEAVTTGEEELNLVDKSTGFISFKKIIELDDVERYAFDDSGMRLIRASANMVFKARPIDRGRTRVEINTKFIVAGRKWLDVLLQREKQDVLDSKGWLEREYFERLSSLLHDVQAQSSRHFRHRIKKDGKG